MFIQTKKSRWNTVRRCCAPFLIAYFVGLPIVPVFALPQGESVRNGRVFFREVGNTLVVYQQSGSAVVNYNSFNIGAGETVRFIQPSSSAAILNRVTGGGRSVIAGNLLANGQVYLINQNGILFSSSARVNVGGLVASGLNMTDGDFFARRMNFSGGNGSVINQGSINAGRVTLVGGEVDNSGSIRAGDVVLAAGGSVVIDRAFGGEIRITIDGVEQPTVSGLEVTLAKPDGIYSTNPVTPDVSLTSEEEDEAVRAASEIAPAPVITNGIVKNTGIISVPGDLGGTITMRGVRVGQFGTATADGVLGDGGDIGVLANELILIGEESHTSANAGLFGNGGNVKIIANGLLGVQEGAYIGVRGGDVSGNGGFVDTSGRAGVDIQAFPDAIAPNGENGYWLIDPPNFYIDDDGDRRDCNFLGFDCEVPIEFNDSFAAIVPRGGTGYMDVDDVEDYMGDYRAMHIRTLGVSGGGAGNIELQHSMDIEELNAEGILIFDAAGTLFINGSISGANAPANMIFLANDQVQINQSVNTSGGFLLVVSGRTSDNGATFIQNNVTTGGGFITVISQNSQIIHNSGTVNAGSGHVFFSAEEAAFLRGTINAGRFAVTTDYIEQSGSGIINSSGDAVYQGGFINMTAGSQVNSSGGDVFITSSSTADITGLRANNGTVVVTARSISDAGDTAADVAGLFGMLIATNGNIGLNNPIDTELGTLGGYASGGTIRIVETAAGGDLVIGNIPLVDIQAAQPITNVQITYSQGAEEVTFVGEQTAAVNFQIPAFTNGLVAQGNGYIEVTTLNGDVTVNRPVVHAGNGSVRLFANGADGDITVNDPVLSLNSFVTVIAQDDVVQNDIIGSAANGYINVEAGDDLIMGASGLGFTGNGNIRYTAGDAMTIQNIITSNGNISAIAGGNITQNSNIISLINGSVDVESTGGSITMANGSLTLVGPNRDIRYSANNNIFLSSLISTQGDISVRSVNGSIRDGGDALPEIIGRNVMLSAPNGGIGQLGGGANALELAATNIAARAGAGGINLAIGGDVTVGTVGAGVSVNRVNSTGDILAINDGSIAGYTTTGGGSIVQVGNGTATINAPVSASGAGNIALINSSSNTVEDIVLNNTVSSGSGNITIAADGRLIQNAAGDITTTGGDIVGVALGSNIQMANGAETRSSGAGDVLYLAASNVTIGSIDSGLGTAIVVAQNGQIIDGGDTHKDILGANAMLISLNGGVGALNSIDTRVGTLAGFVQNGPFRVIEDDDLIIGNVGPVTINLVGLDGLITTTNIPAIPGVIVTNGAGDIAISTVLGDITVNGPVVNFADGNVTLSAGGPGSDLIVNAVIVGADGNILLTAADDYFQTTNIFNTGVGWVVVNAADSIFMTNALTFVNDGNMLYNAAAGSATISSLVSSNGNISVLAQQNIIQASNIVAFGGTIDVDASLGTLTMVDGSLSYAPDNNIRYEAFGDVSLSSLISTQGNVAVFSIFGDILDSGDALPEIIAPNAQLTALNGGIGTMGTNGNPLELVLTNLAARAGGGGINVINVGNLVIGDVPAVSVNRVTTFGSSSPIGGVFRSGLSTLDDGSISLVNLGSLTVDRLVTSDGEGNISLVTATATVNSLTFSDVDIILNTNVSSGSGNIGLITGTDLIQNRNGNVLTDGGDIAAIALAGDLVQVDGVRSATEGGTVAYVAGTNLYLSSLQSGTGTVLTAALAGDVIDNGDILADVTGNGYFTIALNGNVGSVTNRIDTDVNILSGGALDGGLFILEDDDLIIQDVGTITVDVAIPNDLTFQTNLPPLNVLVSSNGSLLVDTVLGDITVNGIVGSLSSNNLRLSANGGDSSLTINETVYSASAPITLLAAGDVNINTTVVNRGVGSVDIEAFNGSITMSDDGLVVAAEDDVRLFARQDVVLGSVVATQSSVHIQATLGSILDGGDSLPEIIAARAQLVATNGSIGTLGVGTDNSLETGIGTLSALASAGGINIVNGGDITVGTVNDVVTTRVNADDTLTTFNAGPLSGLVTTNEGSIVLIDRGSITVDDRIAADGAGNVLLLTQTGEVASVLFGADVTINDTITSGSGHISIIAGQDFQQNLGGDISTDGDIGVVTREGDLVQVDGVKATSGLGNMVFVSSSNMLISAVHALTGSVTLTSVDGTIYDNGDTDIDLIANEVQFFSFNGGVGTDTNGIETTIARVAGLAANGTLKLTETDDLVIGRVEPIVVSVVNPDSSLSTTSFPALAGLIVSNGNLLVDTIDGSITVDAAVLNGGNGNLLLEANGEGQDIEINQLVFAQNGNVSLIASNDIRQNNSVISAGIGSVDVLAEEGSITMTGSNVVGFAGDGPVRYQAREDVTITSLISPSNTVSIIAENGSIIDGGDDLQDVLAPSLRMVAGNGAGNDTNDLDVLIGFLSARGGTGGVHVVNQGITVITTISNVVVDRVLLDGTTTQVIDLAQSDLVTTNGGSISLETVNGAIIVFDGDNPDDNVGISADGAGFVNLSANGTSSYLLVDADIISDLGEICLKADSSVIINTNTKFISTSGPGAIAIWADNDLDGAGDILQLGGTVKSQFGNIYYYGENVRMLGRSRIQSLGGSISIKAGNDFTMSRQSRITTQFGSIALEGNNNLTINGQIKGGTVALTARRGSIKGGGLVTADELSMRANRDIGTERDSFDINAGVLALETKRGDVWLTEEDSVVIGPVPGIFLRFGVPFCCEDMPVANAQPLDQMNVAGRLEFNVGANLGGNVINVGNDAIVDVNGSVNGLDTLKAGGDILLTVSGNYVGNDIIAGGDLDATIGGNLEFDLISAGRVDIIARNIYMSRVIARNFANFRVGQTVFDDDSLITAPDIIMIAGRDIGPNGSINMNVGRIDTIQAGGNMDITQLKQGDTFVNRLQAGGDMRVSLPNGGLVDRNGTAENLISSSATIDARYIGTLSDPMEVRIVPGNLKVDGGGLSGNDTPEGYVWIHLEGEIGKVGDRKIDYIGNLKIPGLIIYNNVILGGKDEILRRFKRAGAFLGQVARLTGPEGILGSEHYFLDMNQPGVGGWNIHLHYIVREMADISGLPETNEARAAAKDTDSEAPAKAVEKDGAPAIPLAAVR